MDRPISEPSSSGSGDKMTVAMYRGVVRREASPGREVCGEFGVETSLHDARRCMVFKPAVNLCLHALALSLSLVLLLAQPTVICTLFHFSTHCLT